LALVLPAASRGFVEYVPVWCGSRSFPSTLCHLCVLGVVWIGPICHEYSQLQSAPS
jgi:hypothetical protein